MTKKHFSAIARAIAAHRDALVLEDLRCVTAVDLVAERLADVLAAFNPAFDRARFLAACRGE